MRRLLAFLFLSTIPLLAQSSSSGGVRVTGSPAANDCAKFVSHNVITTAGAACGAGSGGSVLLAPTTDQTITGAYALILSDPAAHFQQGPLSPTFQSFAGGGAGTAIANAIRASNSNYFQVSAGNLGTPALIGLGASQGTIASPTHIQNGNIIDEIDFYGYGDNGWTYAFTQQAIATGDWTGSTVPSIYVITNGGNGATVNLFTLDQTGNATINGGLTVLGTGGGANNLGPQATSVGRLSVDNATTLQTTDFALGAGWGSTASTAITLATSKDQASVTTITTGGTGIAANPTYTLTFKNGTWTQVPACWAVQTGGNDIIADLTVTARSATAYTFKWNGTPTTAKTYEVTIQCTGT